MRAVGHGLGILHGLQLLRPKRSRRIVSRRGFDADDRATGRHRFGGQRRAGEESAAAARRQQDVELAGLFEQLARGRALTGDHVRVIVGRDEGEPALLRQPAADGLAVVALAVVEDDVGAVSFGGGALDRGRVTRHDDHARDVQELSRQRDRLCVIARGKGDDAAPPFVW